MAQGQPRVAAAARRVGQPLRAGALCGVNSRTDRGGLVANPTRKFPRFCTAILSYFDVILSHFDGGEW